MLLRPKATDGYQTYRPVEFDESGTHWGAQCKHTSFADIYSNVWGFPPSMTAWQTYQGFIRYHFGLALLS